MKRLWFLLCLSALTTHSVSLPPRKLLATGWDSPTPAQFRQHLAAFEQWPFDGTTIQPVRQLPDGRTVDARFAFSREPWARDQFTNAIADLRAVTSRTATDNFLMLYANPGDVDWFDDAGWREIVAHWRLLAWVAHAGGLKGLLFDAEPYTPPHDQFRYTAQTGRARRSFAEYSAKARQRGREVMQAITQEFPNIQIFTYRLFCDLLPATANGGDPVESLAVSAYGLMPAFVNGWLDVMPPTVTIIEGDENAYRYNSDGEFDRAFVELRTRTLGLIAPEHHAKFRAQYRISHGLYLDAHVNPPSSPWFIDRSGTTSAARLEANAAAALRTADEYVWIYGETARWWPSGNPTFPLWPEKLPGAERALLMAKAPLVAARQRVLSAKAQDNRLRNPAFTERSAEGQPKDWWTWQDEKSHGRFLHDTEFGGVDKGAACLAGAENGCFGQSLKVSPRESYAVRVRVGCEGGGWAGVTVRWKTAEGKWTAETRDVTLTPTEPVAARGWRELVGLVRVPDSAGEMVLLLGARAQGSDPDKAWFDDAAVVSME